MRPGLAHDARATTSSTMTASRCTAISGAESIAHELEQSLKRLGTDHIDLYITHWQDPTTPIAETMGALEDLKQAGQDPRDRRQQPVRRRNSRPMSPPAGSTRSRKSTAWSSAASRPTLLPALRAARRVDAQLLVAGARAAVRQHRPGPRSSRATTSARTIRASRIANRREGRRLDARDRADRRGARRDARADRHRLDAAAARHHVCALRRAQSRPGAGERARRAHPASARRNRRDQRGSARAI